MRSSSPFMANAVTAITGMSRSSSSSLSHLVTSRPETSGSWMSIRIRSGRCSRAMLQRIHAVAGLQGAVAVGVEQIVEELHVELVVLHDQHGLGHCRTSGRRPRSCCCSPDMSCAWQAHLWLPRTLAPILRRPGSRVCFRRPNQLFKIARCDQALTALLPMRHAQKAARPGPGNGGSHCRCKGLRSWRRTARGCCASCGNRARARPTCARAPGRPSSGGGARASGRRRIAAARIRRKPRSCSRKHRPRRRPAAAARTR